jgi:hypothetical protein
MGLLDGLSALGVRFGILCEDLEYAGEFRMGLTPLA